MSPLAPVLLFLGALVLALIALRLRGPGALREAGSFTVSSGLKIAPRLVLALLAASFLSQIVPPGAVARLIGEASGMRGILAASLIGALLPGGPMTSFPIAVFIWGFGAGIPQMVALLAGWSLFAFHRVLAYELPMLGWRFATLRLMSVAVIPPLSGLLAALILGLLGDTLSFAPPGVD